MAPTRLLIIVENAPPRSPGLWMSATSSAISSFRDAASSSTNSTCVLTCPSTPHPRELGGDLLQNSEVLAPKVAARVSAQARDVAGGPCQARDEPGFYGVR